MRKQMRVLGLGMFATVLVAACSGSTATTAPASEAPASAPDAQGYYKAENLEVEILDGGPTIVPQQVGSAPDGPEFTISWVPKVLEARESGSDLVDIAQIFQRSGTLSVTWKDSGIADPC